MLCINSGNDAMNVIELLRWQWSDYGVYHRGRLNLLIHIVAVPIFLIGNVCLVVALVQRALPMAAVCLTPMVVSIGLQGLGHKHELVSTVPFTNPVNALLRIFIEQWITFPKFVASGGWLRALREYHK
jgi:Protein of unknown function (DUF962)